jgi:membrane-bound serine protease (ClpP class)
MLGKTVPALTPIESHQGKVFIEGELWNAVSDAPIAAGQPVTIVAIEGLTLKVKAQINPI